MGDGARGEDLGGCRIEEVVGRGGMGVVYRARQLGLDRVVALKVIAPERLGDAGARARFLREARAAAAVDHPNVLPVHAAGVEGERAYLVTKYVDGRDLESVVRLEGPLPPARAAAIAAAIAAGLDAIHAAGLVHRDVKPANVLLDEAGHVWVTDFGLARQVDAATGPTEPGSWVGTADFAAPEQIRGEAVDARTDVYALGCVLHFMLTGRVPFARESQSAVMWAHLTDPPPSLPANRSRFDPVIARALAKAPGDRFARAGALGDAAREAAGGDWSGEETVDSLRPTRTGDPPAGRRRDRRRALAALGAGMAALLVGGAAWLGAGADEDDPAPATPTPTPTRGPDDGRAWAKETIEGVGRQPRAVAVAGGSVWVASIRPERIRRTDAVHPTTPTRAAAVGPVAVDVVAQGERLWIANPRRERVFQVDAGSGRIVRRFRPPLRPVALAVDRTGLWVVGRGIDLDKRVIEPNTPDMLWRYDREGNQIAGYPFPGGVRAIAAGGGSIWISLWDTPFIEQREARTGRLQRSIPVRDGTNDLVFGGGKLWGSQPVATSIVKIGPRGAPPVFKATGPHPAGIAVLGGRVYVASSTTDEVWVHDARTGDATGERLDVPDGPNAVTAADGAIWVTGTAGPTGSLTRIEPR